MIRKVKILIIWTLFIDDFDKNLSFLAKSPSSNHNYRIYGREIDSIKRKNKLKT